MVKNLLFCLGRGFVGSFKFKKKKKDFKIYIFIVKIHLFLQDTKLDSVISIISPDMIESGLAFVFWWNKSGVSCDSTS